MSHQLAKHLMHLMDTFGVDCNGYIKETHYKLNEDGHYDSTTYYITEGTGYSSDSIITSDTFWGWVATRHMRKLKKQAEDQYNIDEINKRILSDTKKYLSKSSHIQEALDDYHRIIELQNEIQKITRKWNKQFTSVFHTSHP